MRSDQGRANRIRGLEARSLKREVILVVAVLVAIGMLSGCASKPVIQTQVIEKPIPVYCKIQMPAECKELYAVDRVSPSDDALTINRAMRIELEERSICEMKLRAALQGCNK